MNASPRTVRLRRGVPCALSILAWRSRKAGLAAGLAEVQVANARGAESLLQTGAVDEGVFGPAHAAPPADITECVDARFLQRSEEGCFAEPVNANGDEVNHMKWPMPQRFTRGQTRFGRRVADSVCAR